MQQRVDSVELTAEGDVSAVKRNYQGMIHTTQKIIRREGASGFFKGVIPNSVRVAPGAAVTFVVYEGVMDLLDN
jgi:solute carrier family 25 (mitochondrial folate transporter), member 32